METVAFRPLKNELTPNALSVQANIDLFWFDLEDQPSQNVNGEFIKRILLCETRSALSFGSRHSSTYPSGE